MTESKYRYRDGTPVEPASIDWLVLGVLESDEPFTDVAAHQTATAAVVAFSRLIETLHRKHDLSLEEVGNIVGVYIEEAPESNHTAEPSQAGTGEDISHATAVHHKPGRVIVAHAGGSKTILPPPLAHGLGRALIEAAEAAWGGPNVPTYNVEVIGPKPSQCMHGHGQAIGQCTNEVVPNPRSPTSLYCEDHHQ